MKKEFIDLDLCLWDIFMICTSEKGLGSVVVFAKAWVYSQVCKPSTA